MDQDVIEQVVERWLVALQQDLKDFLHVVCDDPDLDDGLRQIVTGAVLYMLAPGDVIPDSTGAIGYVDDALALRVALDEVRLRAPERFEKYRNRIPDLVDTLEDDLAAFRDFLGDVYEPFRERVLASDKVEFQKKNAREVLADPDGAAWLDSEVSVIALKLDFKPAAVQAAVRRVASIVPMFRQKFPQPRK